MKAFIQNLPLSKKLVYSLSLAMLTLFIIGAIYSVSVFAFGPENRFYDQTISETRYQFIERAFPLDIAEYPFVTAYDSSGSRFIPGQFPTWSIVTVTGCNEQPSVLDRGNDRFFDQELGRDLVHVAICAGGSVSETPRHQNNTFHYTAVLPPIPGAKGYQVAQSIFAYTSGNREMMTFVNPVMLYLMDPDGHIRGMATDLHLSSAEDIYREIAGDSHGSGRGWDPARLYNSDDNQLSRSAESVMRVLSDATFQEGVADDIKALRDQLFSSLYWFRESGFVQGVYSEFQSGG